MKYRYYSVFCIYFQRIDNTAGLTKGEFVSTLVSILKYKE